MTDDKERLIEALATTHNERAELLHILQVVRPYISDRAGAGILSAVDVALNARASQVEDE